MTVTAGLCCFGQVDEQTKAIERQLQKEKKQLRRQVIKYLILKLYDYSTFLAMFHFADQ